jgi:uncharacterized cupredoxin-like copper-binding protein
MAAGLAACTRTHDLFAENPSGYVADPEAYTASIDWPAAESQSVTLSNFAFSPDTLAFQNGHAYRLVLKNASTDWHYFVSDAFFRAIAVERLAGLGPALSQARLVSIAVPPGEERELDFVAVTPGHFDLACTAPFHAALGMTGVITIE